VWVPDESHEAMRDLVRARAAAVEILRADRRQASAFMLKQFLARCQRSPDLRMRRCLGGSGSSPTSGLSMVHLQSKCVQCWINHPEAGVKRQPTVNRLSEGVSSPDEENFYRCSGITFASRVVTRLSTKLVQASKAARFSCSKDHKS
jgi:hypothetical protein